MASDPPPNGIPALPPHLQPLAREFATYVRELPRLLSEQDAGRFVVIQGDQVYGTWDTYRDASQYAHEKFGLDRLFFIHRVDPRDVERLAVLATARDSRAAACP